MSTQSNSTTGGSPGAAGGGARTDGAPRLIPRIRSPAETRLSQRHGVRRALSGGKRTRDEFVSCEHTLADGSACGGPTRRGVCEADPSHQSARDPGAAPEADEMALLQGLTREELIAIITSRPAVRPATMTPLAATAGVSPSQSKHPRLEPHRSQAAASTGASVEGERMSAAHAAAIAASVGKELQTKSWTTNMRSTVAEYAKLTVAAKATPCVAAPFDTRAGASSGAGGARTSAVFGSTLDAPLRLRAHLLDLARLHDPDVGLGARCLEPLSAQTAVADPLSALGASGAAVDPAICAAVADVVRGSRGGGIFAIAGCGRLFTPAVLAERRTGVARDSTAAVIIDTAAFERTNASPAEVVARTLLDAGSRMAMAINTPPSRGGGAAYDNLVYALALGHANEDASLASRIVRFARHVADEASNAVSPWEVIPLIFGAVVVADTLFFAPASAALAKAEEYQAVVRAFAATALVSTRRPVRGLPPGADIETVRQSVRDAHASWHAAHPDAPPPASPQRPARAADAPTPAAAPADARDAERYRPLPDGQTRDAAGKARCRAFANAGSCDRSPCTYSHEPAAA